MCFLYNFIVKEKKIRKNIKKFYDFKFNNFLKRKIIFNLFNLFFGKEIFLKKIIFSCQENSHYFFNLIIMIINLLVLELHQH